MKKFLLAFVAIALAMAPAAYAAPQFGASYASNSSSVDSAQTDGTPLLAMLLSALKIEFAVKSSTPASKPSRDPHGSPYQCDEAEKSEAEEDADAKAKRSASGPEPVYLAF